MYYPQQTASYYLKIGLSQIGVITLTPMDVEIINHGLVIEKFLTGSSYTVSPPPEGSDFDVVLLVRELESFCAYLTRVQRLCEPEYYPDDDMVSFRNGPINYLVTDDSDYAKRWAHATHLAKLMNLKEKEQRVILFDYVCDQLKSIEVI